MDYLDDEVDFKNLAKEVSYALAKDEKYQRENDAKFRAIHQKVKSYDEFRDIVEASHLKPLDKTDKLGGMSYQKWNQLANSNSSTMSDTVQTLVNKEISYRQPATAHEFSKVWKRSCIDSKSKFEYLISIDLEKLKKCLESDCMLGDVVCVLHSSIEEVIKNAETILNILDIISSTNRFSLALDFLSSNERMELQNVFGALMNSSKKFSLNLQNLLSHLSTKYKI